jgi:hypothetical protein
MENHDRIGSANTPTPIEFTNRLSFAETRRENDEKDAEPY